MVFSKNKDSNSFVTRAFFTWLLFIPVAFINGFVREAVYKPIVGELPAHQISCIIASMAFITVAFFMLKPSLNGVDNKILWKVGGTWLIMTILFEFGLGHYVNGAAWESLFNDYNIFKGRLWSLVLLTILITPILIKRISTRHVFHRKITPIAH